MKNLKYYDENSDDAYDAMKDEGGYPMNDEQRRDVDDWDEECRQNGW
jgi:hypothetical protein